MVIKQIRLKKGTNFCWLTIDSGEYFKIHVDLIVKYRLKAEIEISEEEFETILNEQNIIDGIQYGINKLSYGIDSIANFRNKLKLKEYSNHSIDVIINRLKESGYLDDGKFAIQYINFLKDKKKYGKIRIIQQLRKKGVNEQIINDSISQVEFDDEDLDDIIKLSQKKLRLISGKSIEKQKQSILLFLKNKGYSYQVAINVINRIFNEDK